ncbi:MAG: hypothetical protein LUC37_07530 [Prevotella sp.]|nr:hypothetical protein [Prevotella sp.]
MGKQIKLSEEEIRLGFVASCVEFVATKLNKPYNEVFIRMKNVDMFRNYIYILAMMYSKPKVGIILQKT